MSSHPPLSFCPRSAHNQCKLNNNRLQLLAGSARLVSWGLHFFIKRFNRYHGMIGIRQTWFGPWKTSLTPPQVICAYPKSGAVSIFDVSSFRFYLYFFIYCRWYIDMDWVTHIFWLFGAPAGCALQFWRHGFDLKVFKLICIHPVTVIVPFHLSILF